MYLLMLNAWERCFCVNYTQNLLPIASDNQVAKCS